VNVFEEIINKTGKSKDFFFIQIGSNDGVRNDPLYKFICKFNWSGICVEPVPYLYDKLQKLHVMRKNISCKNVAVSSTGGNMTFYYIKENQHDQTDWRCGNGLGSFNKEIVMKHQNGVWDFDDNFSEIEVKTITFSDLTSGVSKIDLLHIDTEGYDFEIIKTIDFTKTIPSFILFEHKWLDDINEVYEFLKEHKYKCLNLNNKSDTLAIHEDFKLTEYNR